MGMPRAEATGTFVGEVPFVGARRIGADGGIRVFRLRLHSSFVLLRVTRCAGPDSRRAVRSKSQRRREDG